MQFKLLFYAILPGLAAINHGIFHQALSSRQETTATSSFDASIATLADFNSHAREVALSRIGNSTKCTKDNVRVRKLFESLTSDEKIAYTDALKCLMDLPAKTPSDLAPGAKSRYDDWVVTHINQTETIHLKANFLGWHRWYIWEMEQALRNDCGYTGPFPYWDWTKTEKETFEKSEVFDGSTTSLSGNGAPLNYTDSDVIVVNYQWPNMDVVLPHGSGGGCVTSGPFANITVNLGPVGLALIGNKTDTSGEGYKYNPRCLKRDLSSEILHRYVNETSVLTLIRDTSDIWTFQIVMSGAWGTREIGIHPGAHHSLGGDPGRDFWVSSGEPAFWAHHTNIDRVWWMWQMLDPDVRAANVSTAVNGPITMYDLYEPHQNATIFELQNLGYVAEGKEVALGELMSTTEGMFCYVYE
ncbi:hypothetical protein NW755_010682 [Fusarium falciforme]|uniref:Tyrosinase copper-binding domain-containing protein n=1 Tax=Fusarium falciforme TaxID=195108 RepID=A0A9W8QYV2_9HYPO|nr:hypothetical protein NW755_010682 [Fusarium falciforme]